jgi:hypothetical protein
MAEDSLRSAVDTIVRRVQEELEEHLATVTSRHQEEVEASRRTAEAEAEQRWSARVESVRNEWTARLESEVASVRSEAERRMVAESMRLRVEAEQTAAESTAKVRQELEDALNEERERAAAQLASERQQLSSARDQLQRDVEAAALQIDALKQQLEAVLTERRNVEASLEEERRGRESVDASLNEERRGREEERRAREGVEASLNEERRGREEERRGREGVEASLNEERRGREEERRGRETVEAALAEERCGREQEARRLTQAAVDAAAEARVAERQAQLAIVERLLSGIRSMDAARSLTDVLSALLTSASAEAPRVGLFVVNGAELRGWKGEGFPVEMSSLQISLHEEGLLADVLRRGEPVVTAADAGPAAPKFAELPQDCAAIAVPLLVGSQPVAVLYADDGGDTARQVPASWPEAIQILGRHASVNLAHLTAARAADAMRRSLSPASAGPAARNAAGAEDGTSARRYARLLVSEIKLYNEAAVRLGRQKRDLLERLKPEIDRARRLYEQRISSAVDSRGALFHQELIQTLADGDPALLGGPA